MSVLADTPVEPADQPRRRHVWRWVLIVVSVALVGMWAYVFIGRPTTIYHDVYVMTTPGWRGRANAICDDANTRRIALADTSGGRIDHPTPEQMRERADLVDRATDILQQMVTDLAAIPVTGDKDAHRVETFEKYYGIVIADRRDYTAALREGRMQPYLETAIAGGPVSNVVTDFTSANGIAHCAPPGELGG
jgi:hypothetical protein